MNFVGSASWKAEACNKRKDNKAEFKKLELAEFRVRGVPYCQGWPTDFSYNAVTITVAAESVRLEIRGKGIYVM